jgi:hypothetical protein
MDTESLIAHLSGGLAPADRDAFRRAAETALATSPQMLGSRLDFSRYRAAVAQLFSPTNIRGSHHGVGARPQAEQARRRAAARASSRPSPLPQCEVSAGY